MPFTLLGGLIGSLIDWWFNGRRKAKGSGEMSDYRNYVASFPDGSEVLVSIDRDGVHVARRAESWHTWGPPETAELRHRSGVDPLNVETPAL